MAQIADKWITTAERLRDIRRARDSFLLRWATDVIESGHGAIDALSDDLARQMVQKLPILNRKTRLFGTRNLDD
jgi:hypothetical protein